MPGRHSVVRAIPVRRRPRLRWLVGAGAAAIGAATLLAFSPAGASNTANAQLSLTGVATSTSILGGSEIGVHPGDTVDFKASALPTAGLDDIPALGGLLRSLLDPLLGQYQVVASFDSSFPGGAQTVTLGGPAKGKCAGAPVKSFTFPNKGTYTFTWKVQYVLPILLGCTKNGVGDANLNLLQKAGVALNASNSWVGKIVVADDPPKGGISIQLPGVSVAPNVAGHQLPTLGIPGVTLPTLNVPVPNLGSVGSGGGKSGGQGGSSSSGSGLGNVLPVPAEIVPQGDNDAVFGNGGYYPGVLPVTGSQAGNAASVLPAAGKGDTPTAAATQSGDTVQRSSGKGRTIDLASNRASTGQLSIVLAIVAVVALALVAGTYARLYLLRKT